MKDAIRGKYGLTSTNKQIKISSADGTLNDTDTPDNADLEDEDLLDVTIKMSETEMAEAISRFESIEF